MTAIKIQSVEEFEDETWKIVPSVPIVEASSFGRIRSAIDRPNSRWGHGRNFYAKGWIYCQVIYKKKQPNPYYLVALSVGEDSRRRYLVHRLVCEAFHGDPPSLKYHAAHVNGDSLDNKEFNLYWATPQQNIDDRERHKKLRKGTL